MKKVFLLLLIAFSFSCVAQKTYSIKNPLILGTVEQSESVADSVLVYTAEKLVKFVPRSEFAGGGEISPNDVLLYEGENLINPDTGDVESELLDWTFENFDSKKLFYFDTENDLLWFYATKEVSGFPSYEWIKINAAGGGTEQNNFVRKLEIPSNLLSGSGTIEQQICDYILTLPEEDRTIAETDSKWNVVIVQDPLVQFFAGEEPSDLCTSTERFCNVQFYHNGSGDLPVIGDRIFQNEEMDIVPTGRYRISTTYEDLSTTPMLVDENGFMVGFSCE